MQNKYKIEIDGLKEGLRVIIRNRVVKEWVRARVKQYEDAAAKGKPLLKNTIDLKWIEFEVDKAVMEAFD